MLVQGCLLASIGRQDKDTDTYIILMQQREQTTDGLRAAACTAIWKAGTLAYRCRTCQSSGNSAICKDCFQVPSRRGIGKLSLLLTFVPT